jgi:hypothetical protein
VPSTPRRAVALKAKCSLLFESASRPSSQPLAPHWLQPYSRRCHLLASGSAPIEPTSGLVGVPRTGWYPIHFAGIPSKWGRFLIFRDSRVDSLQRVRRAGFPSRSIGPGPARPEQYEEDNARGVGRAPGALYSNFRYNKRNKISAGCAESL